MSIMGLHISNIDATIASESTVAAKVDRNKISSEVNAPGRTMFAPAQAANFQAVSAEEVTFQFSEVVEAKESSLEERLTREKQVKEKTAAIKVEEIQAIMKLIEGKTGYEILRSQARGFAALYKRAPEIAIKQLDLDSMPAEKKYALLTMALDTLGKTRDHADTQVSLVAHIQQQDNPFQKINHQQIAMLAGKKETSKSDQSDILTQAISLHPSIKGIWDLIAEKSAENLIDALYRTRLEWRASNISIIENVGAFMILYKIMTVIQSMSIDTEKILARIGALDIRKTEMVKNYTKLLIDLAQSNTPSTLIEKIIISLKSIKRRCLRCISLHRLNCKNCLGDATVCSCLDVVNCHCTDSQTFFLSVLHLHARGWPKDVWVSADAKSLVLDQLLKKQNAPTGLQAKRLLR